MKLTALSTMLALASALACAQDNSPIPQVVAGGGWKTTLTLFNPNTSIGSGSLTFYSDSGKSIPPPFVNLPNVFRVQGEVLTYQLNPRQLYILETVDSGALFQGYAKQQSNSIALTAVVKQKVVGRPDQEATASISTCGPNLILPFDNTQGYSTGVALFNAANLPNTLLVRFYNSDGILQTETTLPLAANQQVAFSLPQRFPLTALLRGSIHFLTVPDSIKILLSVCGMGLQFNPTGSFTTKPIYVSR